MNGYYIASGVIVVAGVLILLYLATRRRYRDPSAAENYEKIRNKLTVREEEPKEEIVEEESSSGFPLGSLIGAFIVILVGFSLLPTVANQLQQSTVDANVTTAASVLNNNLAGMGTLFFTLAIVTAAIGMALSALRNS